MSRPMTFDEVFDAVETLDEEAQGMLIGIVRRRLAARGRERVIATVEQSRREFAAGDYRVMTAAEIVREGFLDENDPTDTSVRSRPPIVVEVTPTDGGDD